MFSAAYDAGTGEHFCPRCHANLRTKPVLEDETTEARIAREGSYATAHRANLTTMALDGDGRAEAELVRRYGTFDAVAERARRARMKGAALLTAAEFPEEDPGQQFESLMGDSVRLDMATSRTSGAIQYYFHGQGVSPEAEIWHGRREDLFRKLLEPDGLAVGDGRVVSEN